MPPVEIAPRSTGKPTSTALGDVRQVPLIQRYEFAETGKLLVHGDNLWALRALTATSNIRGKVKLVYIDPPFGTRQSFTVHDDRIATISRGNGGIVAYSDHLTGRAYLDFLRPRLVAIKDLMAPDSSIYVHIDYKIGHYVKCLMDEIFGAGHFINDITRIKCNPKNFSRRGYGNIKDMILFYSKGQRFAWNELRQPITIDDGDERFRLMDKAGRRYTTTPLHAPGETRNGATGKAWRGMLPPKGRHWRYAPDALETLERQGRIKWSSTKNPRKIIYADEVMRAGVKIQDVWSYKDPQHPKYPTEKNLTMLEMIVKNSSKPDDIVLDAFCGSGGTLVAADRSDRRWIGIDSSPIAISTCRKRLSGYALVRQNS